MRYLLFALSVIVVGSVSCSGEDSLRLLSFESKVWGHSNTVANACSCGTCDCDRECALPLTLADVFGDDCWLQAGGSYRIRYHNENNMRRAGLTGLDDKFVLHQTRVWLDGRLDEDLNVHAEFMDAASFGQTFRPRAAEVNRSDLYQLYADALLLDDGGTLTARLGRQELRYGSARLIMAPIWANRRRNHDGVRMMWKDADWDIDAFWVRPVFRDVAHFTAFDSTNHNQQLYGVFSTYKSLQDAKLDLYWLAFDIENATPTGAARYDTIGSRYFGGTDACLYEFEGGYQFGTNPDNSTHSAGFFVGGIGKKFPDLSWKPELWFFYDWASGSSTTGNGFHTYLQRAHYYLGTMDLFGRRNLQDFNVRLTTKPIKKLTFNIWYHYFRLATVQDVPYNLNMRPFAGLAAGVAGSKDLGHELDLTLTYRINDQTQVRLAYNYFWAGRFYDTTAGVPTNADADFLYSHFQYDF